MITLGIETSTQVTGVALYDGKSIRHSIAPRGTEQHSTLLPAIVDELLAHTGIKKSDIKLIAVSRGPGSFTGLRVGVTFAKALSFALTTPVVSVDTFEVYCYPHRGKAKLVVPVIDAKKSELFAAGYKYGTREELFPKRLYGFEELVSEISRFSREAFVITGYDAHLLHTEFPSNIAKDNIPDPIVVAKLGMEKFSRQGGDDLVALEPFYFRKSEAK
ncbi:tRNA (adenosine(37)-N6)-threonylcarbamoyltransferase complex dimerization subunit type 1 TsaB [bacterium]|nr:tRNA (adenosine(37)-N6)-threonylcarbamoyltransferase complex dimerization subunit type 1 TsaB [bacterium]